MQGSLHHHGGGGHAPDTPTRRYSACSSSRQSQPDFSLPPQNGGSRRASADRRSHQLSSPDQSAASGCCSCSCRRHSCRSQQISCYALLLGTLSLSCLVTAVMTNLWVHTTESLKPRSSENGNEEFLAHGQMQYQEASAMRFSSVEFDIGLWKICPSLRENDDHYYSGTEHKAKIHCKEKSWKKIDLYPQSTAALSRKHSHGGLVIQEMKAGIEGGRES